MAALLIEKYKRELITDRGWGNNKVLKALAKVRARKTVNYKNMPNNNNMGGRWGECHVIHIR